MSSGNGNEITQWLAITDTTPTWVGLRRTDGKIDNTTSFTTSAEVDPTRQAASAVATQVDIAGTLDGEFPFADPALQLLISSAMQAAYTTIAITPTVSFAGTDMMDDAVGGAFADVIVGDYFVPFGAALNGSQVFTVISKADDDTLTLSPSPTAESAQPINLNIKRIRNSNEVQPLYFQERTETDDLDTLYSTFNDVLAGSMELTVGTGAILTMSTAMLGLTKLDQKTQVSGSTDQAASDAKVIGASNGVQSFFIDDIEQTTDDICFTDFSITIDNGSTAQFGLGTTNTCLITSDSVSVTGTLNSYANVATVATLTSEKDKADAETRFALGAVFKDGDGNYAVFSMPAAMYDSLDVSGRANNTPIKNDGTYLADGKTDAGYTVQFSYLEAP